jgi:methionyl-tRNA formyltransferase
MSELSPVSNPVRIYYVSSGIIGAPILESLRSDMRIELVGVGSQPDRPVGRKQVLSPTAFARYALDHGVEVDRITSVNSPEFLQKMRDLQVEMLVVVAFGQLLRHEILSLPACGCLNVHASLLPMYRGASPIVASILNGDNETGVSFMRMDAGLDTGPVYERVTTAILPDETAGELELRLGALAAESICGVIWSIARQGLEAVAQPEGEYRNVRKISKYDGAVNWSASAARISNMVRAYLPWPRAYTYVPVQGNLRRIQITAATAEKCSPPGASAGQVLPDSPDNLCVACGSGVLHIHRVIPEGKKEMSAADFLRGNPVMPGSMLE